MELTRRRLFTGFGLLIAAPVIVRAASLMPVRPVDFSVQISYWEEGYFLRYSGYDILNVTADDVVKSASFHWSPIEHAIQVRAAT